MCMYVVRKNEMEKNMLGIHHSNYDDYLEPHKPIKILNNNNNNNIIIIA
jgi:hypothetical protein